MGSNKSFFIDTRFGGETARHVKEQTEIATVPNPEKYISIDEVSAAAKLRSSVTGKTTLVFDAPYARVPFAKGISKCDPGLQLREHEPAR